jgi:phospholipid/cholesterol/gamma-HCH transport system permease protein
METETSGQRMVKGMCHLGAGLISVTKNTAQAFWFLVCTLAVSFRGPFYVKQFSHQLTFMGFFSLPLIGLTALFTGMVLAFQSYTSFERFSADSALPEIVALSLTRELGPVLGGLMMAGRWGASIAAELATMRVTDQIDALVTLSTHPLRYLVVPRLLAGVIAMPFLTLVADIIGIVGGYIVGVYHFHIHGPAYLMKTLEILKVSDVTSGLIKSCIFGFIITFIGSYEGYYASGGAQGVGKATTKGVVRSCMLILITNYFVTAFLFSR